MRATLNLCSIYHQMADREYPAATLSPISRIINPPGLPAARHR